MRYGNKASKGHTWKRPYRKSRRFDKTCRCNGSCPWCKRNRLHNTMVKLWHTKNEIELWESDDR